MMVNSTGVKLLERSGDPSYLMSINKHTPIIQYAPKPPIRYDQDI